MEFNFTYAPGTSLEQMIAFEMAGEVWSNALSDDVTVNIHVETTNELPNNVIAGALPGMQSNQSYKTWRKHLEKDSTSANDGLATQNLPDNEFTALVNGQLVDENKRLNLTRANAKALGLRDPDSAKLDGAILISSFSDQAHDWNYRFSDNSVPKNSFDLLSVGVHEIGHILGFVSGVDQPGLITSVSGDDDDDDEEDGGDSLVRSANPLDMFRYSSDSTASGAVDLSIGTDSFFSLDRGKNILGNFSTGEDIHLGGDGYQASHWKQQREPIGIMDPLLQSGERRTLSTLDLQSMDVIGWDLQSSSVNLSLLEQQAKEQLAGRLGVTVDWLETNPEAAARRLTQDRDAEVKKMIKQSRIYDWKSSSNGGWWQTGMSQHILWQETALPTNTINRPLVKSADTEFFGDQHAPFLKNWSEDSLVFARDQDNFTPEVGEPVKVNYRQLGEDCIFEELAKSSLGMLNDLPHSRLMGAHPSSKPKFVRNWDFMRSRQFSGLGFDENAYFHQPDTQRFDD